MSTQLHSDLFSTPVSVSSIQITGGSPAVGKVLTSDATGNGTWATSSSGYIPLTVPSGGWGNASGSFATIFSNTFAANSFSTVGNTMVIQFDYHQTGAGTANVQLAVAGVGIGSIGNLGAAASYGWGRLTMTLISANTVKVSYRATDTIGTSHTDTTGTYTSASSQLVAFQTNSNNGANSFFIDHASWQTYI